MEGKMFIDGDFDSGKGDCKYHCLPTCHLAQVGPEWVYGCTHKAWPQNRAGDFVPIVECMGEKKQCELIKTKHLKRYIGGLKRSITCKEKKLEIVRDKLNENLLLLSSP